VGALKEKREKKHEVNLQRREFITKAAKGAVAVGLLATGAETLQLLGYLEPKEGFMPKWKGDLPIVDEEGFLVFQNRYVSETEVLQRIGQSQFFLFLWYGTWKGMEQWIPGLIVKDSEGTLFASSRKCTHEGCMAVFKEAIDVPQVGGPPKHFSHVWYCHCHVGVFDAKGKGEVLNGPPPSPLPQFRVEFLQELRNGQAISKVRLTPK